MTREQLKERVRKLPMQPGVYMHKDKTGKVIYVGKAKLLKNRVSNYFQPPERLNAKTRQLVSHIDDFDIIVTSDYMIARARELDDKEVQAEVQHSAQGRQRLSLCAAGHHAALPGFQNCLQACT